MWANLICRKRALASGSFVPATSILHIWTPLLTHVQTLHPALPSTLVSRITAHLLSRPDASSDTTDFGSETVLLNSEGTKQDISYDRCLAGWANWLVDMLGSSGDESEDTDLRREDVVAYLAAALGPMKKTPSQDNKAAQDLLKALCRGHPKLEKSMMLISSLPEVLPSENWQDDDIRLMHERLATLLALPSVSQDISREGSSESQLFSTRDVRRTDPSLPPGWRRLNEHDGWKPAPIGVFVRHAATA